MLMIGERLRYLRVVRNLSQGDVEKRTGLLRCYTSRVENGHTTPALGTLAKYANALEVPLYQLFYEGEQPPEVPGDIAESGITNGKRARAHPLLKKLAVYAPRLDETAQRAVLALARTLAEKR